jgi:hypothetical protein
MNSTSLLRTALSYALCVVLPTPDETSLLRACLSPGDAGKRACKDWLRHHAALDNGFNKEATKAFLPLVLHAVQNHGIEVDAAFLTVLRTAALREQLRTQTYSRICGDVFSALSDSRISTIVLGGAALADTVYSDRALRHSHDIDVFMSEQEIERAANVLGSVGFKSVNFSRPGSNHWEFRHISGLPLRLHSRLFQIPCDEPPLAALWSRSQNIHVDGVSIRTLSPADQLLYTCGHAVYSNSRYSLRWVSDAWFIIDRYPELDWEVVFDSAARARLALPLSVMIGFLSKQLDAPIPSRFLERLRILANQADTTCEAAVYAAFVTSNGGVGRCIRLVPKWRERALFIAWMLFPSPSYFVHVWKVRNVSLLPFYYVYRPLRYAAQAVSSIVKGFVQRAA